MIAANGARASQSCGRSDVPRVLNRKTHGVPEGAVYVGRPTKWGNPFKIGPDGGRSEVISQYREWLATSGLDPTELRGKDLVCWCKPLPCHADVLLELANRRIP